MYKKIENLLNNKNIYKDIVEVEEAILKIDNKAEVIDDHLRIYVISGDEIVKLSVYHDLENNEMELFL